MVTLVYLASCPIREMLMERLLRGCSSICRLYGLTSSLTLTQYIVFCSVCHHSTLVPWNEFDNPQSVRALKAYYLRNIRGNRPY